MLVVHDIGDDVMDDAGDDAGGDALRWLTYSELAKAMRIKPASARRLVQRKPWPRRMNNQNEAVIGVPVAALPLPKILPDISPGAGEDISPDVAPDAAPGISPDVLMVIATLGKLIERQDREIEALNDKYDKAQTKVEELLPLQGELAALKAVLEAERARATRLASVPSIPVSRPWWRRLVG
jgi:hypothetical protein